MKKKLTATAVLLAFILLFTAANPLKRSIIRDKNTIKTGSDFVDFIIGMKENTVYKLQDLAGKRFIVLAFLDSSTASARLAASISENMKSIEAAKPGIFWLNIIRDKKHVEITEMTEVLRLRYRTLLKNIPRSYAFSTQPAVLIIDPHGIVQFVYLGYSPTIISDIKNWLRSAK